MTAMQKFTMFWMGQSPVPGAKENAVRVRIMADMLASSDAVVVDALV